MQRITSSSDQVAFNSATQVQSRWGSYEVNWCSVKDAYASSQNIFTGVARAAIEVFANIAKTFANAAICIGNKVYNLLHPQQAAAAPAIADVQQSSIADLEDGDVIVASSTSVSISYEPSDEELEAEEAIASAVNEATVVVEDELPDMDILEDELPELNVNSNPWKKTYITAGAVLGTIAVVSVLHYFEVTKPVEDFVAAQASAVGTKASDAWQGVNYAGATFASNARSAGQTAWSWTGEPIGNAASTVANGFSSAYNSVKAWFPGGSYTGNP